MSRADGSLQVHDQLPQHQPHPKRPQSEQCLGDRRCRECRRGPKRAARMSQFCFLPVAFQLYSLVRHYAELFYHSAFIFERKLQTSHELLFFKTIFGNQTFRKLAIFGQIILPTNPIH